ncbi:MAG: alpha/beta fold hydrolase [bacterium]
MGKLTGPLAFVLMISTTGGGCDSNPSSPPPDAAVLGPCEDSRRPIVMAHGFLASGDTWANHTMRFAANGYCLQQLHAFDYNTLDQSADHVAALDAFIDFVLADSGAEQVDLAGHSMGGLLSYDYLAEPTRAGKVAHYAHVGSIPQTGPPGDAQDVPTLNVWSVDDYIVEDPTDIPGTTNVELSGVDHYGVTTCEASFRAIYAFFNNGEQPAHSEIVPESGDTLLVAGKVVSLGENLPAAGWIVEIYDVDGATGQRLSEQPQESFVAEDDGWWGYFPARPDTFYELYIVGPEPEDIPIHYYREPFVRSNPLVYLRTMPGEYSLAGLLLGGVPYSDDAAVLVNFTSSTGILYGQDSLTVNGVELATEELAQPEDTTIAMFLYDDNENGMSDEAPIPIFNSIAFLNGMDLFFQAVTPDSITVDYNGRRLNVPNWPSASDGVIITVFD